MFICEFQQSMPEEVNYFITYMLLVNKREFNYLFLKMMAIIQGFFISFEYFYTFNFGIEKIKLVEQLEYIKMILIRFLIFGI